MEVVGDIIVGFEWFDGWYGLVIRFSLGKCQSKIEIRCAWLKVFWEMNGFAAKVWSLTQSVGNVSEIEVSFGNSCNLLARGSASCIKSAGLCPAQNC